MEKEAELIRVDESCNRQHQLIQEMVRLMMLFLVTDIYIIIICYRGRLSGKIISRFRR